MDNTEINSTAEYDLFSRIIYTAKKSTTLCAKFIPVTIKGLYRYDPYEIAAHFATASKFIKNLTLRPINQPDFIYSRVCVCVCKGCPKYRRMISRLNSTERQIFPTPLYLNHGFVADVCLEFFMGFGKSMLRARSALERLRKVLNLEN